jgi:cytochrome P450
VTDIVESPEVSTLLDELTRLTGREDPYPRYRRLREISPVVRADDGALVVTRHADCVTVTRDPRLGHMPTHMLEFVSPGWADHPALHQLFTSVLALNPPDHTRLRRLVSSSFTARRVQALRPRIAQMVQDLLARMEGEVDFVDAFAFPLPVNVIGELLGIPEADRAQFQGLVRDWTQVIEVISAEVLVTADPAAATIRAYLADLAAERRRKPGDDLISALVAAEEEGEKLTEEELLTMAALLFAAGFETTTNLLANSVVALLRHPDQLELLRRQPGLAESAVEELLRFDTPVQLLSRVAAVLRRRHPLLPGRAPGPPRSPDRHPGAARPLSPAGPRRRTGPPGQPGDPRLHEAADLGRLSRPARKAQASSPHEPGHRRRPERRSRPGK